MDENTKRRCIELFFTTKGERGTGLGLAMVYGTAQRHNAELNIDSAPGSGTRMCLSFIAPSVLLSAQPQVMLPLPIKLQILIVDDDPVLLKSLHDTLDGYGYMITTASGGQEGIDVFRNVANSQNAFDVVITDLGMPFVDGRKVAGAVKTASPATPVIMLTGWGQRLVAEGKNPENVDRVLSKPPRLQELKSALAELCSVASQ
jgi:CheY-like chemotaxis protein